MTSTKELVKTSGSRVVTPFENIERNIERLFENMWMRPSSLFGTLWPETQLTEMKEISPSVDIYEDGKELIIKADLPGVTKDDLKVEVTGNTLTISGEKKKEEKIEREDYYRYERSHGSFRRSFELPDGMDIEKVQAHFDNGVLELKIRKTAEAVEKIKKISIE